MTIALHNQIEQELKKHKIECKFTFTNGEKKSPKILVATIFRLNKSYKSDDKYINGLLDLVSVWPTKFKDHHIRIYYDDSIYIKNDKWKAKIDKLKKNKYVELIHYDFPQFKESNGYHKGLFGTLVRLLCLFDFEKDTSIIALMDIDYTINEFAKFANQYIDIYQLMNTHDIKILLSGYDPSSILTSGRLLLSSLITDYNCDLRVMMIPTIIRNYRFNKSIIIDFFKCLLAECDQYTEWIQDIKTFTKQKYIYNVDISGGKRQSKTRKKRVSRRSARSQLRKSIPSKKSRSHSINIGGISRIKDMRVIKYSGGSTSDEQFYNRSDLSVNTIPYGIDEFFMNRYLLYHIVKQKIKFTTLYRYIHMSSVNYIVHFLYHNQLIPKTYISSFYQYILGNVAKSDQDKNYEVVDKFLYKNYDKKSLELYSQKVYDYLQKHNIMEVITKQEHPIYIKLIGMFFNNLKTPYQQLQILNNNRYVYQILYTNTGYEFKRLT